MMQQTKKSVQMKRKRIHKKYFKRSVAKPWINRLLITFGTKLLSLWFSTCRITIIGEEYHNNCILANQKMVGATWHRNAIFLVWFFRNINPMVMFSRSRDGDLIAGFAAKLGIIPARGSSKKGGGEALRQMADHLNSPGNNKAATVMDGPTGPPCVAKKGLITLAKMTKQPLLPIMMSASPAITLHKTWDKTLLPLPFSKVVVSYRKPINIPADTDKRRLESYRKEVENTLNEMMAEADKLCGYSPDRRF